MVKEFLGPFAVFASSYTISNRNHKTSKQMLSEKIKFKYKFDGNRRSYICLLSQRQNIGDGNYFFFYSLARYKISGKVISDQ